MLVTLLLVACGNEGSLSRPTATPGALTTATTAPSGPQAVVEPRSGPPGTEITVTGTGWEPGVLVDITGRLDPGVTADPYETVLTDAQGAFSVRFRLESTPDGIDLHTGRYDLIARSAASQVQVPFLVEVRRPISGPAPGG
jgi:hypothetical protein